MSRTYSIKDEIKDYICEAEKEIVFSLYDGIEHRDISREKYVRDILKVVTYFNKNGIKEKHIGIAKDNCYEWLVMFFGIVASKNIAVTLNKDLTESDLQYLCDKADLDYIWCDEYQYKTMIPSEIKKIDFSEMMKMEHLDITNLEDLNGDSVICLTPTSGSTGRSKFVMLTLDNFYHSAQNMSALLEHQKVSDYLLTLPLYHAAGLSTTITMLKSNRKVIIGRGMKYIFSDAAILNPQLIIVVPSVVESMVKVFKKISEEKRKNYIGTKLKVISVTGAPLKKESCVYLLNEGFRVENIYGMTEATGSITLCICNDDNYNSIGKPVDASQCCIDEDELILKGPTIMKGYYKDIEETNKVLVDGCMHSGDLGYLSDDGEYYLVGRKKNVIILSNGENVNPEEIEMKMGRCECIQECLVYSDGKGICIDIYTLDEDEARKFIKEYNKEVPTYQQIYKANYQQNPLEKTGSGKIKRKVNKYE